MLHEETFALQLLGRGRVVGDVQLDALDAFGLVKADRADRQVGRIFRLAIRSREQHTIGRLVEEHHLLEGDQGFGVTRRL